LTDHQLKTKTRTKDDNFVLTVSENADITNLFIKWLYFQDDALLRSLSFEVLCSLIKMACQYEVLKLMGVVSKMLIQTMDRKNFHCSNEQMQKLYDVVSSVGEIQIVVRLQEKVKARLAR